jgi:hypothetical protein
MVKNHFQYIKNFLEPSLEVAQVQHLCRLRNSEVSGQSTKEVGIVQWGQWDNSEKILEDRDVGQRDGGGREDD